MERSPRRRRGRRAGAGLPAPPSPGLRAGWVSARQVHGGEAAGPGGLSPPGAWPRRWRCRARLAGAVWRPATSGRLPVKLLPCTLAGYVPAGFRARRRAAAGRGAWPCARRLRTAARADAACRSQWPGTIAGAPGRWPGHARGGGTIVPHNADAGEADGTVAVAPSVSYSITVRLEVPARGHGGQRAHHRGRAGGGGMVTALDVTESGARPARIDVTCAASRRRPRRPDRRGGRAASTASTSRKVSDRTFLLHLGGKIEVDAQGPAAQPRRPVDGLHARASARVCLAIADEPRGRPPADHQAQHGRRGHRRLRRARPGQHRRRRPRCR